MNCHGTEEPVGMKGFAVTYWGGTTWKEQHSYIPDHMGLRLRQIFPYDGAIKSIKAYVGTDWIRKRREDGKLVKYRCRGEATKRYSPPLQGLTNTDTINAIDITGWPGNDYTVY